MGFVSSGIIFLIANKMSCRDGAVRELQRIVGDISAKGLNPPTEKMGISSSSHRADSVEEIRQQYLDTVKGIYENSLMEFEIRKSNVKELEIANSYYPVNNNVESESFKALAFSDTEYKQALGDIEDYFHKLSKKRKIANITPLEELVNMEPLRNIASIHSSFASLERYYVSCDKEIKMNLETIEEIEKKYHLMCEKYDSGYLIEVATRMTRVRKINDQILENKRPSESDIKYLKNTSKKLDQMQDIPSVVAKEMKNEIAMLKVISKNYTANDEYQRLNFEFLAKSLSDILSREEWGTNPRMEIHKMRSLWRQEAIAKFPKYKHY